MSSDRAAEGATQVDDEESKKRIEGVAAVFDRVARTYDSLGVPWFTPIAERLVTELAPAPGERAVDIGCGRGAALFALAAAIGSTGEVVGIDVSKEMIEATREDAAQRGLDWIDLKVADASAPDLSTGHFDIVSASLVAFFLPDPLAAVRAWSGLLAPGGRLGISTFGDQDERWKSVEAIFRPYLPPDLLDARTSGTTGHFADAEAVTRLVAAAGLESVRTLAEDLTVTFRDAEQWRTWSQSHGQRVMWDAVPPSDQATVVARVNQRLADLAGADGKIQLTQQVRYTVGQKG